MKAIMPFESQNNHREILSDRSEEAMQAARELIEENEMLNNNSRVKALSDNNFITEDGRELDPGNFIAAMLNYIESQETGTATTEEISSAVDRYTVDKNLRVETSNYQIDTDETIQ